MNPRLNLKLSLYLLFLPVLLYCNSGVKNHLYNDPHLRKNEKNTIIDHHILSDLVINSKEVIELNPAKTLPFSVCSKAGLINCGNTVSGTTVSETNSISSYNCLSGATLVGPDKVYYFTLQQSTPVSINLTIQSSGLDLDLFLLSDCGSEVGPYCIARSASDNTTSRTEQISQTLSAGTYYIVIDGQYASSKGAFTLSLSCNGTNNGGGEGGSGTICDKATSISCGNTLSSSNLTETNVSNSYSCLNGTMVGPEKVFKFTLSEATSVTINLSISTSRLDLDLFLMSGCGSSSCIASSTTDNSLSNQENIQKTLSAGTYYIVVDGQYSTSKGNFQISLNCGTQSNGSICEKAMSISCGNTVSGTTVNETNTLYTYDCLGGFTLQGPEKVYKLVITQQTQVSIDLAIQSSGLDLDLFLLGDVCADYGGGWKVYTAVSGAYCIDKSVTDNRSSNRENISRILNPGTYYVIVDGQFPTSKGAFQLSVSCGSGSLCSKAKPISCGTEVNGSTNGETNYNLKYNCETGTTFLGPEAVYKFTLSERQDVVIDLNIKTFGRSIYDLDLFLLSDCSSGAPNSISTCIAKSTSPNTINTFENISVTLNPGTYYIVVDAQNDISDDFILKLSCGSTGTICNKAMPISCGNTVNGSTVNETNTLSRYACLPQATLIGPEKVYKLSLTQRTPITIDLSILTPGLDLDLFLLRNVCQNVYTVVTEVASSQCIAQSTSDNSLSNREQITITLDPGDYYIVVDGQFSTSRGAFQLAVNCCDQAIKRYDCNYITYKYTGNGSNLKFSFASTQNIAVGKSWRVNDLDITSATGNSFEYTFLSAGSYEICYPYLNSSGCIEYCCYQVNIANPFDCNEFDYSYNNSNNGFQFTLNKTDATNVSWVVDDTGQGIGNAITSNVLPLPGNCVERTITVRYYWNGRWYLCCRRVWLCNPFDCLDFDYRFVSASGNSGYQFTLNKPGASNVKWIVDDTGSNLGSGFTSQVLPLPGSCISRTITVRYYWNGRWYICCRTVYLCNPLNCNPITYRYVANQGYQFSLNETGTSNQTWAIDETGQDLGSGLNTSLYVAPPSNCVNYTISVRYFKNGIWYICCLKIRICDPINCNNIRYVTNSTGYELTLDEPNSEQISWLDDDNNSKIISSGARTTVIPLPSPCRDRLISVRYYDPVNGIWRYCCVLVKCGTPLPTCTNDNCDLITYRYLENSGFEFKLNQAGATDVNWSVLETGQQVGTGVIIGGIRPVTDCQVRTFIARYTLNGQVFTCCRRIWMCDPFNCTPFTFRYTTQGYQFNVTETGTSNQTWAIDGATPEPIGNGIVSNYVVPPSNGNCITRIISLRYFKNNTWYYCCQRVVICDPFNCNNISYGIDGSNYNLTLDDSNANQIVWLDDNNNGAIINQNVKITSVPVPVPCVDRIISVRYYDPISQTWRYCCKGISCGQNNCQLSVSPTALDFISTGGEKTITVTANSNWSPNTPSATWIKAIPVNGSNQLKIQVEANPSPQTRTGTVTITCGATRASIQISQEAGATSGGLTPPWDEPQISSASHTVAIFKDVQSQIGSNPLQTGDYIGFFFKTQDGKLAIAGKKKWEAKNTLITVYGDDGSGTPGFKPDETFNVKVWRLADQQVYDVTVEYLPLGTPVGSTLVDAKDKFKDRALSAIGKISKGSSTTYEISLKKGWNLIGSKVKPETPNMENIFQPIVNKIRAVKAIDKSYIPGFGNDIGDWDITQGYFIYALEDVILPIAGTSINPTQVSIPLHEGWQIIPYFCDINRPLSEIFADSTYGVEVVKGIKASDIYVKGFSAGFCMEPGQGYQVKIKGGTKRQLLLNCTGTTCTALQDGPVSKSLGNSSNFVSANNASILIYKELLGSLPNETLVKVFDTQGQTWGEAVYQGKNLQINIFGDDPYTEDKDGLFDNEVFELVFLSEDGKRITLADLNLELPSVNYHKNDLIWVRSKTTDQPKLVSKTVVAPNPAQHSTWLNLDLPEDSQAIITMMDIQGRIVGTEKKLFFTKGNHREEVDLRNLQAGVYLLKVTFKDISYTHRLIVQ